LDSKSSKGVRQWETAHFSHEFFLKVTTEELAALSLYNSRGYNYRKEKI